MSYQLTPEQIRFAEWLNKGHWVEICSHRTTRERFINGIGSYSGRLNIRTVERLLSLGLLSAKEVRWFGVLWLRYELSSLGVEYIQQRKGSSNATSSSS